MSSYHFEASIASLHCTAKSFSDTDRKAIASLYARLLLDNPNPFVELNHAIALYYAEQKQDAFQILNKLLRHPFLSRYSLLSSTLGKFHWLEGNNALARQFLLNAFDQTNFTKEKNFIQKMIYKL